MGTIPRRVETLKLVTVGRKTGLPHIVRIRFVEDGDGFLALGGSPSSDWVRNVLEKEGAKLRSDELIYEVRASVSPADGQRTRKLFETKYGRGLVSQWYGPGSVCVRLVPTGPPIARKVVRGEASATRTFASWRSESRPYYGEVAAAFDSASEEYDVTIGRNFINTLIRQRSLEVLYSLLKREDNVLEIGAGTGAEAVQVARRVAGLVATDISPQMVELLQKKAASRKIQNRVSAVLLAAGEISDVRRFLPGGAVRIAYSFNGALNCEPKIDKFADDLATIVRPGGYFVCSIRNTICVAEMVAYGMLLRRDGLGKRKVQPMMVSVGGMDIPSTYYSASEFARRFEEGFEVRQMIGLPVLLPPAYLNDYYVRWRRMFRVAERADELLAGRFPFNRFGDQTLYVFRRR